MKVLDPPPPIVPIDRNVIKIVREGDGGWLTIAPNGHAWLSGDLPSASAEARALAANLDCPIRVFDGRRR